MKKLQIIAVLSISCIQLRGAPQFKKLLEATFDTFVTEVVAQEDQDEFRRIYNDLVHEQQQTKLKKKTKPCEKMRNKITTLQKLGKNAIEVRNPSLAYDLKQAPDQKKTHKLYYRYGVYEDFLKNKAQKQKSIVTKTKAYMRDARNKVTAWFGNLRKPKTTTA